MKTGGDDDEGIHITSQNMASPAMPQHVFCPECGMRTALSDTFSCRDCGRDHLCQDHYDQESKGCERCAVRARQQKAGMSYRLPTDPEWSCAVGLPQEHGDTPKERDEKIHDHYPWGKEWPPPKWVGNYDQDLYVDMYSFTSQVGSFKANRYELYDMGAMCENGARIGMMKEKAPVCCVGLRGATTVRPYSCPHVIATALPISAMTTSVFAVCWSARVLRFKKMTACRDRTSR